MNERIRTVAVLGAGVMGSGIAAHLAGAGLDVLLLDIVPPADLPNLMNDRNLLARSGVEKALKAKPAAFFTPRDAERITVGNFEDDLAKAGKADLIIEAVKEDPEVKRALYARLEPLLGAHTIVASNTSGLPISVITQGRGEAFRRRFLVLHFFNPVRYMKLLEVVAGTDTAPEVTAQVSRFADEVLGKGVIFGKDTPNFVANRIGVFAMMYLIRTALEMGLSVDEVDAIFGPPMGRPKSAVFRTADIVGLDTVVEVARNCHQNLPHDEQRAVFEVPEVLTQMVAKKLLGDKTGGGFYKKAKDGILALDLKTLEYQPQKKPKFASVGAAKGQADAGARVRAVVSGSDVAAQIAWKVTAATLCYASRRLGEIADDIVQIDRAMRWGFGWDQGRSRPGTRSGCRPRSSAWRRTASARRPG